MGVIEGVPPHMFLKCSCGDAYFVRRWVAVMGWEKRGGIQEWWDGGVRL